MPRIVEKKSLADNIIRITVEADEIASKAKPGQFVVLVVDEAGERIPLTLADCDKDRDTVTLIFQAVGFTTKKLGQLNPGQQIAHLLGPLGHPTQIDKLGTVVCIGGGVGIAELYPIARAFKQAGNRVISIIGARSKNLLIMEEEIKKVSDEIFVTTDDGSYAKRGFVTDVLKELFAVIEKSTHTQYPQLVYCVGPVVMMKAVAELTRGLNIKTIVSVNPIMVDATGMCGACRCKVGGKTVFGCVDGPDFDGHALDFDELEKRLKLFKIKEEQLN